MGKPITDSFIVVITLEIPVIATQHNDWGDWLQPPDNSIEWKKDISENDLTNLINAKIQQEVDEHDF